MMLLAALAVLVVKARVPSTGMSRVTVALKVEPGFTVVGSRATEATFTGYRSKSSTSTAACE